MAANILLVLALAFALGSWIAHWIERRWLYLTCKPLVMLSLIAWSLLVSGWHGEILWFGLALIFSLLGDVALMFRNRFFLHGLAFFLIAHLFYLVGFNLTLAVWQPLLLLIGLASSILSVFIVRVIIIGLRSEVKNRPMQVPVLIYSSVLLLMFMAGISKLFDPGWALQAGVLVALGAGLFYISDIILAYNRFVKPLHKADIYILVPYHLAQVLIMSGVLMRYMV
jgi:uncharacterized membrane protein YhhN